MREVKNLNCLLPKTEKLLLKMIEKCDFLDKYVLVGGSALAMHLCHRKSEDLGFFTYKDSFGKQEIYEFIKYFEQKEILNQTDEQIDLFLDGVKVTFFNANWSFLKPKKIKNFNIATLESIVAMKINTIFLRAKFRDYYDLYFLSKKFDLQTMFQISSNIVEGINFKLFATALVYVDDIEDDDIEHLEPVERIDKFQIRNYFEMLIAGQKREQGVRYCAIIT